MPQYQGIWTLAQAAQLQSTQRWATDPLFENTTLLLQADNALNAAQNNTFLDSSSNNFTITRNGNTTQGTFSPFSQSPGWWGNYFDGTGDYLVATGGSGTQMGTGAFTWECWCYITTTASYQCLIDTRTSPSSGSSTGMALLLDTGTFTPIAATTSTILTSSISVTANAWNHVALTRTSGGTLTIWVNGASGGTVSNSTNLTDTLLFVGGNNTSPFPAYVNGYLSNVRIVKGSDLYAASFTPPTSPLTAITNTGFLTCQSNRFVDNSTNAFAITVAGNPSVQAFSPFAPQYQYTPSITGGSGYFDGTGDTLTAANNAAFQFGTGDFEISAWVYPVGSYASAKGIFANGGAASGTLFVYISTAGRLDSWIYGDAVQTPTINIPLNAWTYITVSRVGTAFKTFINGVQDISYTTSTNISAQSCIIGDAFTSGGSFFSGYIEDLRVRKGSGVTSVTVPTSPLTAIANTQLLLNFTNAGIYDGTLKNNLETVGNAQISTAVVKYGTGSMAFDGTGDYLSCVNSNLFTFEGDFTIECWIYLNGTPSTTATIIDTRSTDSASSYIFYTDANRVLNFLWVSPVLTTTLTIPTNQWVHVAVTRANGTIRQFVGGVVDAATRSTTSTISSTTTPLIGGGRQGAGLGYYLNGYLDDLRVTKGIARYTANFTPPTVALPRQ